MPPKHLLPTVACVAILAGCAAPDSQPARPASAASAIGDARIAFDAGMPDKGVRLLKEATVAYPADKQPWLKLAQHQFDSRVYGEALASALQVLALDPNDVDAHGIVAVSGLRLSVKALTDLSVKNSLGASVKGEAKDLARQLRTRLGDEGERRKADTLARAERNERNERAERKPPTPARAKDPDDPFASIKE